MEAVAAGADLGDAAALIEELQRLSLALREEHGVACTILRKDGRVVALKAEQGDGLEEDKEGEAAAGGLVGTGGLVGHEQTDVVLKINGSGAVKYLHASSGKIKRMKVSHASRCMGSDPFILAYYAEALARHSPYFKALFAHPFSEAHTRVVALNLPCVDALEPTLYHLYTGKAPEPLPHGGRLSVSPALLFGLLANAKYLLLDALTADCAAFLARLVEAGTHEGTCTT